jgi:hypothetical protein
MPLDEELYEAVVQAAREGPGSSDKLSPRFVFWVLFLVVGFFVVRLVMVLKGWG